MNKKNSRKTKVHRKTRETDIQVDLQIDGSGQADIQTPVPFFNHMLDSFTRHGLFDLKIHAKGDVEIDDHHTVEDTGLSLGQAFQEAMSNKEGINRFGWAIVPFDEVLVTVAVDLSGRPSLVYRTPLRAGRVGGFEVELVREFFIGFTNACGLNLHIVVNHGRNRHHIIEGIFKACGRAMDQATQMDPRVRGIPSTKGVL